jgi:hypothetical protein
VSTPVCLISLSFSKAKGYKDSNKSANNSMNSTWTAYRKTEPLRWTSYMEDCLRILEEGKETEMDILLATQVKCHIIGNMLSSPAADEPGQNLNAPSEVLVAALLKQLQDIQQRLPSHIRSHSEESRSIFIKLSTG